MHTPLVFDLQFEGRAVGFEDEILRQKTRIMVLPYGEEIMIAGRTMCAQSTSVTDGQTDRFTMTNKTALCIASRGNKRSIRTVVDGLLGGRCDDLQANDT